MKGSNMINSIIERYGRLKAYEKQLGEIDEKLEVYKRRFKDLEEKINQKERAQNHLQSEGDRVKKELQDKKQELKKILAEQEEVSVTRESVTRVETGYHELLPQNDQLKSRCDALERLIGKMVDRDNLDEVVKQLIQVKHLRERLRQGTERQMELETRISGIQQAKKNTEQDIESLDRSSKQLYTEHSHEIKNYRELDRKIEEMRTRKETLETQKSNVTTKISQLRQKQQDEQWYRVIDENKHILEIKKRELELIKARKEKNEIRKSAMQQQLKAKKEQINNLKEKEIGRLEQIRRDIEGMLKMQEIDYRWLIESIKEYPMEKISQLLELLTYYSLETIQEQQRRMGTGSFI